jgi:hypothetical protein
MSAFQPVMQQQHRFAPSYSAPTYFQQQHQPRLMIPQSTPMMFVPPHQQQQQQQQMMMSMPHVSPNKRDLNLPNDLKTSKKAKVIEPKNKKRQSNGTKFSPAEEEDEASSMNGSACGLGGEHRLTIHFQNLGERGIKPQTFGKSGYVIPDGVSGTHRMYSQSWQFEITHSLVEDCVVLTWKITNLSSGGVVATTETPQQAELRQTKGNTICNMVLRKALEQRI